MTNRKFLMTSFIFWIVLQTGSIFGETTGDYLPLDDGNTWIYRSTGPDGVYQETETVLPGTTIINGVETKAVKTTGGPDSGTVLYVTNDMDGIRSHAGYIPGEGWLYFEPPLVLANRAMNIGETVNSSGRVRIIIFDYGTYFLNYESSNTIETIETITVPAGSYETIRTSGTDRIYGYLVGNWYEQQSNSTGWSARHIGDVKSIYQDSDGTVESILVSTNVQPLPARKTILPFLPLLLD